MDPENGDYRLAPGSPAQGYGCQTFTTRKADRTSTKIEPPLLNTDRRRDEIVVSGPVLADTTWDADLVRVTGYVTVADGVTLGIAPGTRVQFEGYYRLTVLGTLNAVGTAEEMITFTTDRPSEFQLDRTLTGCWNGIRFHDTLSTNGTSRLEYCVFEYSKAVDAALDDHDCGGGAVSAVHFSQLTIAGCIFRSNLAEYGGALYCYDASPAVYNNLFTGNHVLVNASAIYCGYSYPRLINNTIVGNPLNNQEYPYEETGAIVCFLSKPALTNNIVRDNDPDQLYIHTQVWQGKEWYTRFNNIEAGLPANGNIDADPLFCSGPEGGFYLSQQAAGQPADSPCLDAGSGEAVKVCLPVSGTFPCIGLCTSRTDKVNDAGQADMGYHYGWKSAAASLTCLPGTGTLPFQTVISADMTNLYSGFTRTLAARINIELAGGQTYGNWRAGHANIGPDSSLVTSWAQTIPALPSVAGLNRFTLVVEDVTPAPYNQPPYPPAGDADSAGCNVIGLIPLQR
jgi:hypothetical protein